jgi:uncharacterized protein (TIGR03437 family)
MAWHTTCATGFMFELGSHWRGRFWRLAATALRVNIWIFLTHACGVTHAASAPVLSFSTFFGNEDSVSATARDSAGNIVVAGTTYSSNFPLTTAAAQKTPPGGDCGFGGPPSPCPNAFVAKFTGDGSTLLFSTYVGASGPAAIKSLALDASDNVYVLGRFLYNNFPKLMPLGGSLTASGIYVAKLSSDGSSLAYATMVAFSGADTDVTALAVDASGAVYLTGFTSGELPVVNAFQITHKEALIFKTSDSGRTWTGLMDGLPEDLVDTISVDPTNPQTLYLGLDQGLYKSTDAGAQWTAIQNGTPPQAPYPDSSLSPTTVAVDPANPQTVYLGTLINGIYKSTNGGGTWVISGAGASRFVRKIIIDPKNTSTLYAATNPGLYKSIDGGATWNPTSLMAGPDQPYFVHTVVIDPVNTGTLYAGTPNGVMKSTDAGQTWTRLTNGFTGSTDVGSLVIDPVSPQNLYAATNPVYRTTDGGAHWSQGQWPTTGGYVLDLLVDPVVHSTVWAATDMGILVSRDAGVTWAPPATPLPESDVQRLAAGSDGTLYAITNGFAEPDAFVMKLDSSGSRIVYATYLGGLGSDAGQSIAVDSRGQAYILGFTDSFDFPVASPLQAHLAGGKDAFLSVLDPSGARLVWSTYLGGSQDEWPTSIAVDSAGDIHIAGWTYSPDFPLRQAADMRYGGKQDGFAAKVKGDGSAIVFSTYLGGSNDDYATGVAADAAGNTYVSGVTDSSDLPVVNAIQSGLSGTINAFVAALNGNTGAFQYLTYLGGGNDGASSIVVDPSGDVYVAGATYSPDFPNKYAFQSSFGFCPMAPNGCGVEDAFLAEIAAKPQVIHANAVANAASYTTTLAPGAIASIFGLALAVTQASASGTPLPDQLSDLRVLVNGLAAPLYYVSPVQVNFQMPFEAAPGQGQIQVVSSAGTATLGIQVAPTTPGIFTLNSQGTGAGAIEHGISFDLVTEASPAGAGEIISIYCTGLGTVSPALVSGMAAPVPPPETVASVGVTIAGITATVIYAGLAPGFAGLYQVNAEVPTGVPAGDQPLQISANGVTSNAVTIPIR